MSPSWMSFSAAPTPMTRLDSILFVTPGRQSLELDLYTPTTTTSNEFYKESQVDTHVVIHYNDNSLAPVS